MDVADVRQTFYNINNVYDLFTNVASETIWLIDALVFKTNFSNISSISTLRNKTYFSKKKKSDYMYK
jgi:hypothetical protein